MVQTGRVSAWRTARENEGGHVLVFSSRPPPATWGLLFLREALDGWQADSSFKSIENDCAVDAIGFNEGEPSR